MASNDCESTRRRALELLNGPRWSAGSAAEAEVRKLLPGLRRCREFKLLAELSELLVRAHPREAWLRKLQTQALIEIGQATSAIEVARAGLKKLPGDDPEWGELTGLIGRASKHIALDTSDPTSAESIKAMRQSLLSYAKPLKNDPDNTWSAINLLAMSAYAKRIGAKVSTKIDVPALAHDIIARIEATPAAKRDHWAAATLAEASLAIGKIDDVERHLKQYMHDPKVQAFEIGSTLRQFSEVWGLKQSGDPRMRGMLQAMRARLMKLPGAQLNLPAEEINELRLQRAPDAEQLQAILGNEGTQSYEWWKLGLDRARAVAAIRAGVSRRIGTGFLVPANDFRLGNAGERLLLTNYHVVNAMGTGGALRPEDAQVAFEAIDAKKRYRIAEILWASEVNRHDACLLRLEDMPADVEATPIARRLPIVEETAKVYVIGHPGGGELEYSFQDNALLDHEGEPKGAPQIPGVCRLHYRAPTEKGSSGSPVYNAGNWEAIALHHAGGELSQLNGKPGTHLANEGVALSCIIAAVSSAQGNPP